jgi:hypothetical protein
VELFHPSASMIIKWEPNGIYHGREEIKGWFATYKDSVITASSYLHHKIASPLIEVNGDKGVAHSYLTADSALKDTGQVIVTVGHYKDECIKSNGSWYFKKKEIYIDQMYVVPTL